MSAESSSGDPAGRHARDTVPGGRTGRLALVIAGAALFAALVTLNAGGYRYGASDQAFYIPVVLEEIRPELFPHDRPVIAAQDRLLFFDDWFGPLVEASGLTLPTAFLIAQIVTLFTLYGAVIGVGLAVCRTHWGIAGMLVLMTIRHRIPHTGANSVEGYFHPRMLAFGVGLSALALYLHGRVWMAMAVVGVTVLIHPTIGVWYALLLAGAAAINGDLSRRTLVGGGAVAAIVGLWALGGELRDGLVLMDDAWLEVLALKDYLVIPGWPLAAWPSNLAIVGFVIVVFRYRQRLGLATDRERAVVGGCLLLLAVFLLSAPISYAGVALAVQLQVNRVFWLIDYVGVALFAWLLFEAPWFRRRSDRRWMPPRRALVVVIALLALWRGGYRGFVERPDRPVFQVGLAASDWHQTMRWAAEQPVGTHFLADPVHAARYGISLRAASGRDVYLELVKDSALAIYSPEIADRVSKRLRELGDFEQLTERRAEELARLHDIDFLITERPLALPVAHRAGPLVAYDLGR